MLTKSEQKRIFAEACNGFGFQETEQEADGLYCTGCMVVHKRPTKMYRMGGTARDRSGPRMPVPLPDDSVVQPGGWDVTDTKLTCAELYRIDSTFKHLVDEWVEHRRCPIPLTDRCLDFDLADAASCARWAATEPKRAVFPHPAKQHGERGGKCGPYPACNNNTSAEWCWCPNESSTFAFDYPIKHGDHICNKALSPLAAILWLLDNWKDSL